MIYGIETVVQLFSFLFFLKNLFSPLELGTRI